MATATFPGLGPHRLVTVRLRQRVGLVPPEGMPAVARKHEEPLTHEVWQPGFKTPGCLHIPVMREKPEKHNPEQLFTLAFLSCRRSWLGNHESNEILYGMSKNKRNKSRLTHSLSPPRGAAEWECLPSQLLPARCPARTLAVCVPLDPLSRCLSHCL